MVGKTFQILWLAYNNRGWELCLGKPGDRLVFPKNRNNFVATVKKNAYERGCIYGSFLLLLNIKIPMSHC